MKLALLLVLALPLAADTITVPFADDGGGYTLYPEFDSLTYVQGPGFATTLGTLNSVDVNWQVNIDVGDFIANFNEGLFDPEQFTSFDYNSVATVSIFGFSSSASTEVSGTIADIGCLTCAAYTSFDMSGDYTITDPTYFEDFEAGSGGLAPLVIIFANASVLDTAITHDAVPTDGFTDPHVYWTSSVTYSYTPVASLEDLLGPIQDPAVVPEPRWGFLLIAGLPSLIWCAQRPQRPRNAGRGASQAVRSVNARQSEQF